MDTTVTLDPRVISIMIGTVIPILVGLLTKIQAPSGVKAAANALLSALSGALVSVLDAGGTFVLAEFVLATGFTWVTSVATYYGLLKPSGVSQKVQERTADVGVGPREDS